MPKMLAGADQTTRHGVYGGLFEAKVGFRGV
jgi:hypothetical protein